MSRYLMRAAKELDELEEKRKRETFEYFDMSKYKIFVDAIDEKEKHISSQFEALLNYHRKNLTPEFLQAFEETLKEFKNE